MTVDFTVYDPVTGEILRFGYCALDDWELQPGPGEMLWKYKEQLNDLEWKIVDGEKVRK